MKQINNQIVLNDGQVVEGDLRKKLVILCDEMVSLGFRKQYKQGHENHMHFETEQLELGDNYYTEEPMVVGEYLTHKYQYIRLSHLTSQYKTDDFDMLYFIRFQNKYLLIGFSISNGIKGVLRYNPSDNTHFDHIKIEFEISEQAFYHINFKDVLHDAVDKIVLQLAKKLEQKKDADG